MTILKRAFRNIWRSRFRTLLIGIVLALCVAVFVSVLAGVDASKAATARMLQEYGEAAEATLEAAEQSMTAITVTAGIGMWAGMRTDPSSQQPLNEGIVDAISAMDGVDAVVPSVTQGFGEAETWSGEGDRGFRFTVNAYQVHGIPLDASLHERYHILPASIVAGRNLEEGDTSSVLIGELLTDYFGAGVGDTINIDGKSFEVVGVYESTMTASAMTMQNQVYMSLPAAQDLLGMKGQVSSITVYAESVSAVDVVSAQIESEYPDLMVMDMSRLQSGFGVGDFIQRQQQSIIGTIDSNLSSIQSLSLGISVATGIICVLLIFGLMFYTVRERTKEIGTLKALGFSNSEIMKQFMYEGSYIGIIGGAVGLAIAAVAASSFATLILDPGGTLGTSVSVSITLSSMLLGIGVAAVAGALGSLYPAWRASRVSPMEALRRE